jgi:hypothetical protein
VRPWPHMMRPRSRAKFIGLAIAGAATEAGSPRPALRVLRIANLEDVIDSTRPMPAGEPNLSRSPHKSGGVGDALKRRGSRNVRSGASQPGRFRCSITPKAVTSASTPPRTRSSDVGRLARRGCSRREAAARRGLARTPARRPSQERRRGRQALLLRRGAALATSLRPCRRPTTRRR